MYPELKTRYFSSFIDGIVILIIGLLGTVIYQGKNQIFGIFRTVVLLGIIISYEPFFVSKYCTIGQAIMGIRVRKFNRRNERISLLQAYFRTFLKGLLGILSFFTMAFNKEKRAIHDYGVKSVVLDVKFTRSKEVQNPSI